MDHKRYPRKYLDWKPTGRNRWIQNIGDAVRRRNTTFDELEEEDDTMIGSDEGSFSIWTKTIIIIIFYNLSIY